jgi:hypothetical protein
MGESSAAGRGLTDSGMNRPAIRHFTRTDFCGFQIACAMDQTGLRPGRVMRSNEKLIWTITHLQSHKFGGRRN